MNEHYERWWPWVFFPLPLLIGLFALLGTKQFGVVAVFITLLTLAIVSALILVGIFVAVKRSAANQTRRV